MDREGTEGEEQVIYFKLSLSDNEGYHRRDKQKVMHIVGRPLGEATCEHKVKRWAMSEPHAVQMACAKALH